MLNLHYRYVSVCPQSHAAAVSIATSYTAASFYPYQVPLHLSKGLLADKVLRHADIKRSFAWNSKSFFCEQQLQYPMLMRCMSASCLVIINDVSNI